MNAPRFSTSAALFESQRDSIIQPTGWRVREPTLGKRPPKLFQPQRGLDRLDKLIQPVPGCVYFFGYPG